MKWVLIAIGVVAGLVALVALIGVLLPRDHVAGVSARIPAAQDSVWVTIIDVAAYPSWRSDVKRIEILPATPTGPSWREHSGNGAITYVAERVEAPRRLVTRIADQNLPFGGSWEYRIEPAGPDASTITIVERGSVYNPIFRFVSRFLMGHTATITTYLRALGKRFGGEVTPTEITIPGDGHGI